MNLQTHPTEGIILRVIPFRDYDQIVSLFTPEAGLIKVLCKGSRNTKRKRGKGACMPLTQVEVSYREKKGEIFGCDELICIEMFPFLRKDLCFLEVACDLLQVILDSQFMGKSAPQLYSLLCYYLKKIPQTANPWLLAASFRLKLLKHDGLVGFPFHCSECGKCLDHEAFVRGSEGWCKTHHLGRSQSWDSTELKTLYCLADSQSFKEICLLDIQPRLQNKIAAFFKSCMQIEN